MFLKESQNWVRSMAIIHEKLYKSNNMSKINFQDYIKELTDSLLYSYHVDHYKIQLNKNIDKIFFDVNTAIPCGLIINELITNSLKHAFPDDNNGLINIELFKRDEDYELNVYDTGVGFPDDINFENTESLGLQLVNNLVKQVDGTIGLESKDGTKYNITFKESKYKKR
jgi:two-component sensor histidine kinase